MSVLPLIDSCPKRMEYGPCGGVGFDGSCEVDAAHRCAFVHRPTVPWTGLDRTTAVAPGSRTAAASATLKALGTRPWIVADLPARALSVASIDACAAILTGEVDAVLAGDAGSARVQFPPAYRAHLLQRRGLRVWTGLNMRDRNRVAIEGELAALAVEGVAGVHCVTGDHTRTGHRPDAAPVFDLDSTEATALARAAGHVVSVAASPAAPPVDRRAARLREKIRAGADVCFVNHAGGAVPVRRFIAEAGNGIRYIPCVPVVVDHASADLLESFTTLVLPEGFVRRIRDARDPRAEGIALAAAMAQEMLAIPGVVGVNLSGGREGAEESFAEALAEIAQRVR
ncbi:5,10-methylenetetrahydrofolate reductase [Microbacterium sp. ru370.1]|uniref:methylenetetrahydrofolate reductase C-terminal domain-containing protein n=1 Tax=unclassified Microbacterium TaxID=2609290 RepID=UPI0008867DB1|nr:MULTISPECIES: methylenetetrahydrofolate reductase C-terminal domain-containing protein [unclassified Microbacterium]SDO37813.1 5,10-methylenetetrahydrofolate reductase [Microbacterium sp. ru370.1]SIT78676.1 5,10-methylenetetrahydrofolate reductase [Microbacterium sp. RU1D]